MGEDGVDVGGRALEGVVTHVPFLYLKAVLGSVITEVPCRIFPKDTPIISQYQVYCPIIRGITKLKE